MDRINDPSATSDRKFTDGDDLAGIEGTIVTDDWANGVQEELTGIILGTAQTLNPADNTQVMRGLQIIARGRVQVFATPGTTTWTVPAGVYRVKATVIGGGGPGGFATAWASGGGGSGGRASKSISVTPGQVITITVGAAGIVATTSGTSGTGGGTSSFGSAVSANGGGPGGAGASVNAGGAPGNGFGGDVNDYGAYGGDAIPLGCRGGDGGGPGNGRGTTGYSTGVSAFGFGGGGGGGGSSNVNGTGSGASGGNGMSGLVIVEY